MDTSTSQQRCKVWVLCSNTPFLICMRWHWRSFPACLKRYKRQRSNLFVFGSFEEIWLLDKGTDVRVWNCTGMCVFSNKTRAENVLKKISFKPSATQHRRGKWWDWPDGAFAIDVHTLPGQWLELGKLQRKEWRRERPQRWSDRHCVLEPHSEFCVWGQVLLPLPSLPSSSPTPCPLSSFLSLPLLSPITLPFSPSSPILHFPPLLFPPPSSPLLLSSSPSSPFFPLPSPPLLSGVGDGTWALLLLSPTPP